MPQEMTKNLVFAFLDGQASLLQKKMLEEWLADPAHQDQYYRWLREWELDHPQYLPQVDDAWAKLGARMEAPASDQAPLRLPAARRKRWNWLIAASVGLWAAGMAWLLVAQPWLQTYQTGYGELKQLGLPDGTQVTLNANSTLEVYWFGFGRWQREVLLTGEAVFSVKHLPDHQPFLVKLPNQAQIEVLGTEFAVYARARKSQVALHSGSIRLNPSPQAGPLLMQKGDVVTIGPKGQVEWKQKQATQNHLAWRERKLVFDNTPLTEVAEVLRENFGAEVQLVGKALASRRVSGTFTAQNAEELLQVLAEMLEARLEKLPSPGQPLRFRLRADD
jgi:ferric-dicitrate binding protein FerR (iron transport regulator)